MRDFPISLLVDTAAKEIKGNVELVCFHYAPYWSREQGRQSIILVIDGSMVANAFHQPGPSVTRLSLQWGHDVDTELLTENWRCFSLQKTQLQSRLQSNNIVFEYLQALSRPKGPERSEGVTEFNRPAPFTVEGSAMPSDVTRRCRQTYYIEANVDPQFCNNPSTLHDHYIVLYLDMERAPSGRSAFASAAMETTIAMLHFVIFRWGCSKFIFRFELPSLSLPKWLRFLEWFGLDTNAKLISQATPSGRDVPGGLGNPERLDMTSVNRVYYWVVENTKPGYQFTFMAIYREFAFHFGHFLHATFIFVYAIVALGYLHDIQHKIQHLVEMDASQLLVFVIALVVVCRLVLVGFRRLRQSLFEERPVPVE